MLKDVQVGEATVHVKYAGTASQPTAVLLHGFPDSLDIWDAQFPVLEGAGFRVVALDLPGYGQSSLLKEKADYAIPNLLRLILGALDALDVGKFHLVAHDWGAVLGWVLTQQHQDRVESYVAVSVGHSGAFFTAGGNLQRMFSWYMLFFQYPEAEGLLAANDWQLWRSFFSSTCSPAQVEAYTAAMARPGRLAAALSYYKVNFSIQHYGTMEPDPKLLAAPINVPVMSVWGEKDAALTQAGVRGSEKFIAPNKYRFEHVAGVGHWVPRDAPEQLNALLLDFLKPKAGL